MADDDDPSDEIVQLADHVARAGATVDDSDTLRDLTVAHAGAATAAYQRAMQLSRDATIDAERERWNDVALTITGAAVAGGADSRGSG